MNCEWAILCENIEPHQERGFSIVGVFSEIITNLIPHVVGAMRLALRFTGPADEGAFVHATVLGPDGQRVGGGEDQVAISSLGQADLTLNIAPVQLPRHGIYRILVSVDGRQVREVRFAVNPVQRVH